MARSRLSGWTRRRLAAWLSVFFLALAVPTAVLIHQAYGQLKYESFHQYRQLAEDLSRQIDRQLQDIIATESAHSFTDYAFLNVSGDPKAKFLQRSPLSAYPVRSALPGIIGYFQIDAAGKFSSPLLPNNAQLAISYGISRAELTQRRQLQERLLRILSENRLLSDGSQLAAAPAPARPAMNDAIAGKPKTDLDQPRRTVPATASGSRSDSQQAFDKLQDVEQASMSKQKKSPNALGRVEELNLKSPYAPAEQRAKSLPSKALGERKLEKRVLRKERSALPETTLSRESDAGLSTRNERQRDIRVHIFESQIDAFEISLLDSGQIVLYRKVWRNNQRYIQGALIDPQPLFHQLIESVFRETALSQMSNIAIAYRGNVFAAFSDTTRKGYLSSTAQLQGALLARTRLSAPWSDLELIFYVRRLPAGAGAPVLAWTALILAVVLCGGFVLMYRLGTRQLELARQQQDFVSAVSHELKTPLTSIRMYGEILREGWAGEDKKREYYDYIYSESERLSRLIGNVLQLARMTRNDLEADCQVVPVGELLDNIRSRISSQIERAGFRLELDCDDADAAERVIVDGDFFTQIIINLVDNALKFAANADNRTISLSCRRLPNEMVFGIRDYGPGIPRDQLRKVFKLFYRANNELTRETIGTGIGLALVRQLATAMEARVDVNNRQPGVEFQLHCPVAKN